MMMGPFSGGFETPQQKQQKKQQMLAQLLWSPDGNLQMGGPQGMQVPMPQAPQQHRSAPITGGDQQAILEAQRAPIAGLAQMQRARTPTGGGALAKGIAAAGMSYLGAKQNKKEANALKKTLQAQRDEERDLREAAIEQEEARYQQGQAYQRSRDVREDLSSDVKDDYYGSAAEKNRRLPAKKVKSIDYLTKDGEPGGFILFEDGSTRWEPGLVEPDATGSGSGGGSGDMNPDLSRLTKHIEPIYRAVEKGKTLAQTLMPYMVGGERGDQDIPGVGMFEGSKGTIGNVLRASQGKEAQKIATDIAAYRQELIKMSSGLAQTQPEIAQTLETLGQEMLVDEAVNLRALHQSFDVLNKVMEGTRGMVTPDVMDVYRGSFDGEAPIDARVPYMNFSQRLEDWPTDPNATSELDALKAERDRIRAELQGEGG